MSRAREAPALAAVLRRSYRRVAAPLLVAVLVALVGQLVVRAEGDRLAGGLQPLVEANAEALQLLTDAETGLRGFQLTGRPAFLEPYERGVRDYPPALARARAAAGDDEVTTGLIDAEQAAARRWVGAVGEPVTAGRAVDAVLAKRLFDELRAANDAVARRAGTLREAGSRRSRLVSLGSFVLVAVLALLALGYARSSSRRATRALTRHVDDLNRTVRALAAGDLTARATPTGPAELRSVAASVNDLGVRAERDAAAAAARQEREDVERRLERAMRGGTDPAAVLGAATAVLGPGLGADRAYVRLIDGGRPGAAAALWPPDGAAPAPLPDVVPWNPTADPFALLVVSDAEAEPGMPAGWREYVRSTGVRAYVSAPLRGVDDLAGYLTVQSVAPRRWSAVDVALVERAGREIALALGLARTAANQREAVERLTSLDRIREAFVATVSHELRTPLTSIAGYLELLADGAGGPLSEVQARMVDAIDRNTARLQALIDDLLTLSSVDSGRFRLDPVPLDLREVVEAAVTAIRPVADAGGLTLVHDVPDRPLPVEADRLNTERALLNLLSNAVKYTPAGGTVTVTAADADGGVAVAVADTGIGIPAAEQDSLFRRFFRASNARASNLPGTGLGLALVRELIGRQDGELDLRSEEGRGTTVTVRLPRRNAAAVAAVRENVPLWHTEHDLGSGSRHGLHGDPAANDERTHS